MNILVTGSNGQLGTHLKLAFKDSKHSVFYTDVDTLDITSAQAVQEFIGQHQIELVINCAAYTNVDGAEDNASVCDLVNHQAVAILADAIKSVDGMFIHISTDYVFGGNVNNTPCTENQSPNPTGVYGRTKLLSEQAIVSSGCKHVILRTAWLYCEYGHNFVKTMLNATAQRPQCMVVYDQVGTPTYAGDLAHAIVEIINQGCKQQGIFNYSNEGVTSWYDFANAIATLSGHTNCQILPVLSSQYPSKVVRPPYSVLDKAKIKQTYNLTIPHWYASLVKCLANMDALAK